MTASAPTARELRDAFDAPAPLSGAFGASTFNAGTAPATLTNGTSAGNLPVTVSPTRINTPYVQNFSFQIQQEFFWGTVLTAGYAGALGRLSKSGGVPVMADGQSAPQPAHMTSLSLSGCCTTS